MAGRHDDYRLVDFLGDVRDILVGFDTLYVVRAGIDRIKLAGVMVTTDF
jgi:hypothetical protein